MAIISAPNRKILRHLCCEDLWDRALQAVEECFSTQGFQKGAISGPFSQQPESSAKIFQYLVHRNTRESLAVGAAIHLSWCCDSPVMKSSSDQCTTFLTRKLLCHFGVLVQQKHTKVVMLMVQEYGMSKKGIQEPGKASDDASGAHIQTKNRSDPQRDVRFGQRSAPTDRLTLVQFHSTGGGEAWLRKTELS